MVMKATAKPEMSKKWWIAQRPADIKGIELERVLASAEKVFAAEKKARDPCSIEACLAVLDDLETCVKQTIKKECDKKKHKDVIAVLEKYFALINSETKRLEDLKKTSAADCKDDEESDHKIFQKDYLYKMVKLMKSTGKEVNFGFGLDTKNPEASTLVLTRKGKPERLFKTLKSTGGFTNRLITYGKASADPENGKVLILKLAESAGEPPQVLKLGRKFLRSDKALKFRKLKLVLPGGKTFHDTERDPDDVLVAGGPTSAGGQGKRLSPQQKDAIRKRLAEMERRLDELMAGQRITT